MSDHLADCLNAVSLASQPDGSVAFSPEAAADLAATLLRASERMKKLERVAEAIKSLMSVINSSEGIAGWHLSGAVAEWGEFPEIDALDASLAALDAPVGAGVKTK